jgi:hypothetical protein
MDENNFTFDKIYNNNYENHKTNLLENEQKSNLDSLCGCLYKFFNSCCYIFLY